MTTLEKKIKHAFFNWLDDSVKSKRSKEIKLITS